MSTKRSVKFFFHSSVIKAEKRFLENIERLYSNDEVRQRHNIRNNVEHSLIEKMECWIVGDNLASGFISALHMSKNLHAATQVCDEWLKDVREQLWDEESKDYSIIGVIVKDYIETIRVMVMEQIVAQNVT